MHPELQVSIATQVVEVAVEVEPHASAVEVALEATCSGSNVRQQVRCPDRASFHE